MVEHRNHGASGLSLSRGAERVDDALRNMQRGLVYPAPFARFITFFAAKDDLEGDDIDQDRLGALTEQVREHIHSKASGCGSSHTTAIVGVCFPLWRKWCEHAGKPLPKGMRFRFPDQSGTSSKVFAASSGSFQDSGGVLWFHIKSNKEENCEKVAHLIKELVGSLGWIDPTRTVDQPANSRPDSSKKGGAGKILGRRFSENLNNPSDPVSVAQHVLVGYEDPDHLGASYAMSQRFLINWGQLYEMSPDQIEDVIGRHSSSDVIIPSDDERRHIRCARVRNARGESTPVLRLGLPFGSSPFREDPLKPRGYNVADERGLYFAGFARDAAVIEQIMHQMIGSMPDTDHGVATSFMRDRVFNNVKSDMGGFFYIPSRKDLGLDPIELPSLEDRDWSRFPGVDWSRLDQHFNDRSKNGLMFYNHKDYLYTMSTASGERREQLNPPSTRILELLAVTFSLWQDNWYFNRKQQEIGHLREYVARDFGDEEAERVMASSIMERKGWATRMSLRLFASAPYGVRGQQEVDGQLLNGSDTYHIHPLEIIVGGMPNPGLGQGCYIMKYLTEAESISGFMRGLSEASGVGHVIPNHAKALQRGLGAMKEEVRAHLSKAVDEDQKAFYRGVEQSLIGVTEYMLRYAALAEELADGLPGGCRAERENLAEIAARMRRLSEHRPETFVEAVQLIFTLHVCIHLSHEPVSLGRLDQLLIDFYEGDLAAGRLTEAGAQEILDAFWIKIGEKIQQNRMMVEDHQPTGNMAMGGASGPYPQGSSNNQWLMQVTVGGTVADESPGAGKPAYNAVTRLALRCARRLPLNAPCLSLRTRKDMPRDILEEASRAILSGGAHPFLMSDEKLIPSLHRSGDDVGGLSAEGRTLAEETGDRWCSTVSLTSARNYACDGCYEPQFPGENWFTLAGGFTTLNPLEAALNQGRLYTNAGPTFFTGQNASFNSRDATQIATFEELEELYFEHFKYMYTSSNNGIVGRYGAISSICPAPLLSAFMDDCLAKGRDFHDGGAKYNIIGPEFVAVSSTVNSLWAIRAMVFDEKTAVTSLPELVRALLCDWGNNMVEPFFSDLAGPGRKEAQAERYRRLREVASSLPRYGRGQGEIDAYADRFLQRLATAVVEVFTKPLSATRDAMKDHATRCGTTEHPFGFQIQPGVGTFEGFCDFGAGSGASADGRLNRQAIASDLSPSPSPMDQAPHPQEAGFVRTLRGYSGEGAAAFSDGAPVDVNIAECYPQDKLVEALQAFANGEGSNMLTITCADPEVLDDAISQPEKYDLLRVRMGGWTEYFTAMFRYNQEQHRRRPLNVPD